MGKDVGIVGRRQTKVVRRALSEYDHTEADR